MARAVLQPSRGNIRLGRRFPSDRISAKSANLRRRYEASARRIRVPGPKGERGLQRWPSDPPRVSSARVPRTNREASFRREPASFPEARWRVEWRLRGRVACGTSHANRHSTPKKPQEEEQAHNTSSTNRRESERMGRVVALVDALFFQMKLAETAKQLGVEVKVAANCAALLGLLEPEPTLVIVALNARSQPVRAIERLRSAHANFHVVGFLSHVQRELAAQAQQAGCNEVMPRSSFTQNLAAILEMAKD